jgi:hypothetical protein
MRHGSRLVKNGARPVWWSEDGRSTGVKTRRSAERSISSPPLYRYRSDILTLRGTSGADRRRLPQGRGAECLAFHDVLGSRRGASLPRSLQMRRRLYGRLCASPATRGQLRAIEAILQREVDMTTAVTDVIRRSLRRCYSRHIGKRCL